MIEISVPSSKTNTHTYLYNMSNTIPLIQLNISESGIVIQRELSVPEAEVLAKELIEWVREIKGEDTPQ
jgi:hypothetical protein